LDLSKDFISELHQNLEHPMAEQQRG
jgi:hypothetical protein